MQSEIEIRSVSAEDPGGSFEQTRRVRAKHDPKVCHAVTDQPLHSYL